MVVQCDIEFDQNKTNCYFSGQLISGTIVLKCDRVKEVKAIQLQISGYAQVSWSEKSFNKRHNYEGREDYLASTTYLMGSENSSKNTIAVGVYTYTFACQLPQNCPSSFEGKYGHVRYTVRVALIRPWKFDQTYVKAFTVLRLTDLNFESPQIRIPSQSESYRTFCCGPLTTDPLKIVLKTPQAGYVPGQSIPLEALIINSTNIAVSEVKFSLIMIVRYTSENPAAQNVQRISVSKIASDGVLRNCTRSLRDEIHIPATPPTCLQTCKIIQIAYQVEMEVKMKSCQKFQVVTIPVIIGNIPLANNTSGTEVIQEQPTRREELFRERPIDMPLDFQPDLASAPTFEMLTPNLPPPSYEESYHTLRRNITEGERNAFGPVEFAPVYPVYKIPSPTFEQLSKPFGVVNNNFEP